MRVMVVLAVAAWTVLACSCAGPCWADGFSVPGTYAVALDSHSTLGGPNCTGTDTLTTGTPVLAHFSDRGPSASRCITAWIDSFGAFSAPRYSSSGALGDPLAAGEFTVTLASGCTGRWEVGLSNLDRGSPMGTTPDPTNRPYLLTRTFIPDDTASCHTQFGAFMPSAGAVCADSWAVHLVSMGP